MSQVADARICRESDAAMDLTAGIEFAIGAKSAKRT